MESPFNFDMALAADPETGEPVVMQVLEARESASRRRGYKVVIGFKDAHGNVAPVMAHRLECN